MFYSFYLSSAPVDTIFTKYMTSLRCEQYFSPCAVRVLALCQNYGAGILNLSEPLLLISMSSQAFCVAYHSI